MYYARISINGGALCLPVLNNNSQAAFRTVEGAKARLESMGSQQFAYGYDKSKGDVRASGQVLDGEGRIVWSICL
jgi:hypothetical protein